MRYEPAGGRTPFAEQLLAEGLDIVEEFTIPARDAYYGEPPQEFAEGKLGEWLATSLGSSRKLYRHQASSLAHVAADKNVVLATPTASGKSLVFMAAAIRCLVRSKPTVLVFYPQKALGSDQLGRWRAELQHAGLSPDLVGEITGDTKMKEREAVLRKARIILATPDVMQCWMMPALSSPPVDKFLKRLELLVLDEAHALERVFGTNAAFFMRRLRDAKRRVHPHTKYNPRRFQVVAATATLEDPARHLAQLTGLDFVAVGEDQNGAPSHPLTLVHVDGPDTGAKAEAMCAALAGRFASLLPQDAAQIAFADSRQGVERIIHRIGRKDFLPYRGGYQGDDRHHVERELREGRLAGVIATSALELGIDLPQFALGMTLGVPFSRKALRQRIGRIGRAREGVFLVVAPRMAFARLGTTFREFATGPVEQSPLYLENEIVQFQNALCLVDEAGGPELPELAEEIGWPKGFRETLQLTQRDTLQNPLLHSISCRGSDHPHYAFSLRSMPGENLDLRDVDSGEVIGTIDCQKALRETYHGATYHHFKRTYRVLQWRYLGYGHEILLKPVKNAEPTQPILGTSISCALGSEQVIDGHHLNGAGGCFAEVRLDVTEYVEGYRIGGTSFIYKDLAKGRRIYVQTSRRLRTTGVILRINEPWFCGEGEEQIAVRRMVAAGLRSILGSMCGIAPADIAAGHRTILMRYPMLAKRVHDAVVLFDEVEGGLRLTAPVFERFEEILDRLDKATRLAGDDAPIRANVLTHLRDWYAGLKLSAPAAPIALPASDERRCVFAPGSVMGLRLGNQIVPIKLLEPALVPTPVGDTLMYRYESAAGVSAWAAHDKLEPTGDEWTRAFWDPLAGTLEAAEVVA